MALNRKYGLWLCIVLGALGVNLILYMALSQISNTAYKSPDVLYDNAVFLASPSEVLPEPERSRPERKAAQEPDKIVKQNPDQIYSARSLHADRPEVDFKKPELKLELNPKIDTGIRVPDLPSKDHTSVSAMNIFSQGEVDQIPRVMMKVNPVYPYSAKRRKIEGRILIGFVVDTKGFVQSARVLESEPEGVFDESGLKALKRWRFKPGYVNGEPVSTRFQLPLVFKLSN